MENSKHAVLRKIFTGVDNNNNNAEVSSNRWGRTHKSSNNSNNNTNFMPVSSKGIPVTGSVRERAKAFEERYAGNSAAFVPCPTPEGQSSRQAQQRVVKSSMDRHASVDVSKAPSAKHTLDRQSVDVRQAMGNHDKENMQPERAIGHDESASRAPTSSKIVFPAQRTHAYDLPAAPRGAPPLSAMTTSPPSSRTPKLISSPPSQQQHQTNQTNAAAKPTLRAGAFQAARSRSNSTPRPSEWLNTGSPVSSAQRATPLPSQLIQRQQPVTSTPPPNRQKPTARPVSMIVQSSPAITTTTREDKYDSLRVSAVPIPRSRKTSGGSSSSRRRSSRLSIDSIEYASPARPVLTQRSVSAHPGGVSVSVDHGSPAPRALASPETPEHFLSPAPAASARTEPTSKATSMQMERAKSAIGPQTTSTTKVKGRPRSLTLTARSPAELDSMFQDFIESLNLPESVSRKMMSVDARVKLDMLRSGTPASTVSKATMGQSTTGQTIQPRMPIPSFGESSTDDSNVKGKKRPTMLRKMKSFMSNKETASTSETPEGFLMVEPLSPRMDQLSSPAATSKLSFDYASDIDPAVSQAAAAQAHMIKTKTVKSLDPVKDVRKLRVLLRNESLPWVLEWIKFDGYKGLMDRLHEILTLEWREEQHDDQVLLELLKCFRGLLMSQPGRQCLASFSPSPFRPLMETFFSEKKPGELAARQCIVEIISGLFDIFPSRSVAPIAPEDWRKPWTSREAYGAIASSGLNPSSPSGSQRSPQLPDLQFDRRAAKGSDGSSAWESAGFQEDYSFVSGSIRPNSRQRQVTGDSGSSASTAGSSAYALVRSLLIGPPNEKEEAQVHFIKNARRTRVFKLWMDEVIGVLSDYFWIFCHSSNSYWRLENIEEDQLEEPKVPGGMTGGVEYEAMEYCAAHLRLLNRLCRYCPGGNEAIELHSDLFMSGIDKVLLTLRKCSTTYYPQIHLELARYVDLCLSSGYPLHPNIRKYIEPVTALKESISAGKLARQAAQQKEKAGNKKGHNRSRTEGQIDMFKKP